MKIDIRAIHFELDPKERDYAAEKIGHLEKYYRNVIGADIGIECDHEDHSGSTYNIKAIVKIPGKDLFAETSCRDILSGIDILEERLKEQILKVKERSNPKKLYKAKEWVRNFFGK
jgi:putative sigma-54 modulation protein